MLEICESFINETEDYSFGESGWYEPFTDDRRALFRNLQREYGGCISKVYRDKPDGSVEPVGWVFQKRMEYEDAWPDWSRERRTYIRHVWVLCRDLERDAAKADAVRAQIVCA